MSAAPELRDLGALGCTRDGYQLIGVGMLLGVGTMFLSFAPFYLLADDHEWLWPIAHWFSKATGWISLAAGALVVLGIAATSADPHGPFPRRIKGPVAVAYAVAVLNTPLWQAQPFQSEGWSFYLQRFGEGLIWLTQAVEPFAWPVAIVLLSGCSALFAWRRGVVPGSLAWALFGGWTLGVHALPWPWFEGWSQYAFAPALLAGCFAPLYLARRLRLEIRTAAGVAA